MQKVMKESEVEKIFHEDHEDFELVEEGDWISEGKYELCSKIFKDKEGLFWEVSAGRSGSYHSDWYYMYETTIVQVERKEVITTTWVEVA